MENMRSVRLIRPVTACVVLAILAAGCAIGWRDRLHRLAAADQHAEEVARTMAEHAARTVGAVDLLLRLMADDIADERMTDNARRNTAHRLFQRYDALLPQTNGFAYVDDKGRLRANAVSAAPEPVDLSARRDFQWLRDNAEDGLLISPAIVRQRDGEVVIPATRRMTDPTGRFIGTINALIDPDYFRQFYDGAGATGGEIFLLLNEDGHVLASSSAFERNSLAAALTDRIDLERAEDMASGRRVAVVGVDRLAAMVAVRGAPLFVLAVQPAAVILAPWWQLVAVLVVAALASIAVVLLVAYVAARWARRERAHLRALANVNQRFDLAVDAASAGIWDWTPADDRLYCSPLFSQLVGIAMGSVPQTLAEWGQRIHPDDLKSSRRAIGRHLADPSQPYEDEYRLRADDGGYRWFRSRGRAMHDEDGKVVRMSGAIEDITRRKEVELALAESRAQLQTQAQELRQTAAGLAFANNEAQAQRRVAEAANRSKSSFLAMMSHEIRTPLNAIMGFSEIIRDMAMGPDKAATYREYAGYVHDAGKHLLSLVNDILDLSKIEAGKMDLRPVDIDVGDLVDSCLSLTRGLAYSRGVTLESEEEPVGGTLFADQRATKQMIVNLLSNALKFTESGGRVVLTIRPRPDGGGEVVVRDTGIGMSAKDMKRALQPFGQVDNVLTRKQSGTGLGVPMVKNLIELHGGTFAMTSEPGKGTVVTLTFPARAAQAAAA
jgi:PAS domain S-box-containing protein